MSATTVSEALAAAEGAAAEPKTLGGRPYVAAVPARPRARESITVTDGSRKRVVASGSKIRVAARARSAAKTAGSDVAGAWVWRGSSPTLRDLWQQRIPALDRVPGESKPLHVAWVVGNHAALPLVGYLNLLSWALQHPARWPLFVLLVAPVIYVI